MARTGAGGEEEGGRGVATKMVAQDLKGAGRVAEGTGDLCRGAILEEVGTKGLVLTLLGGSWVGEEALAVD
jgi:hypothetical protein